MSEFTHGHACIIGIGADLPNTANDAIGLANILNDPERCAYPAKQVRLLTQEQASRENILAALDQLAQATTVDSTVIIYFSGYGYHISSPIGEAYYLMPFGYDPSKLYKTAISGVELTTKLRAIPAKKMLLLLDCCHAGGLENASTLQYEATKTPFPLEMQALFADSKGRAMIASSQADEESLASRPYGAFTLALIEALAGKGVATKDGYVRVADLALYTSEMVPQRTRDRQHPILNVDQADNFELAYYAAGATEPKELPLIQEPKIEPESGKSNRQIIQQNQALGDRSIVIGGNASGRTVITGNSNVVGSDSFIQYGKYNFNAHFMNRFQNGDTYNPPKQGLQEERRSPREQPTSHKQKAASKQNQELLPDNIDEKEVFISYAWAGTSEEIANQIEKALQENNNSLIRDKNHLGFKGRIKAFMERIGRGKCVVVIISEKYLKSENCMFELLQIAKNEQFYERIFPIVLDDAKIYKPIDRIQYVQHWEKEIQALDQQIRSVSSANLEGFREDIDLYNEIRQHLPRLTNILKDMNTLTVQIHSESGFAELIKAIQQKLEE